MQGAQRDVLIVSPYFVPGAQMMGSYRSCASAAWRIRVLTNSLASNDAPAAHAGYARYRPALLKMGVELYEMRSDPNSAGQPDRLARRRQRFRHRPGQRRRRLQERHPRAPACIPRRSSSTSAWPSSAR
jgi:phosphatidylserine/phosphatidylglycerophosphate/cardiolipin synthase-like enzyme